MTNAKPTKRPANPNFSSGPCAKHPGWTAAALSKAFLGRSHRSNEGKARLKLAIDKTKEILEIRADYHAFEMAMWTMLGARGVDQLVWESFGKGWHTDIIKQLKLKDVRTFEAPYGALPDLSKVDFNNHLTMFNHEILLGNFGNAQFT